MIPFDSEDGFRTMKKHGNQVPQIGRSLAASISLNTLFGIMSYSAQVGTRLVTVPFVIHYLGLGGYGIWNVIMATSTYMRFGSVGVKTAFQKYVAEATGNGDYGRASKLLTTGCAIMLVLSGAGLIPAAVYSRQIARLAGVPPEMLASAAGAISLLAVIMAMANVGAVFEAIVMGGHRIDLVRKFGTVLTIAEAVAIVLVLYLGYGLFAMAGVMGTSELIYISCCWYASRRVVPEIRIRSDYVSKEVVSELFRFAGSYQIVNLLEVLCVSLLPFGLLKTFGAQLAGVYAIVSRVVGSAAGLLDSFLPPILSAGTMVYAAGSPERMQALLTKAFKVTLTLSLFPFGYISVVGTTLAYVWTGQTDTSFRFAFWLVCLTALFKAFSLLSFVLYRVSGRGLLDNLRQIFRIVALLVIIAFADKLGFYGVLTGVAVSELAGMCFMLFALTRAFRLFRAKSLWSDAVRLTTAAFLVCGAGAIASHLPLPGNLVGRLSALLKLVEVSIACLLVAWPVLLWTGSVTSAEVTTLFAVFLPRRNSVDSGLVQNA